MVFLTCNRWCDAYPGNSSKQHLGWWHKLCFRLSLHHYLTIDNQSPPSPNINVLTTMPSKMAPGTTSRELSGKLFHCNKSLFADAVPRIILTFYRHEYVLNKSSEMLDEIAAVYSLTKQAIVDNVSPDQPNFSSAVSWLDGFSPSECIESVDHLTKQFKASMLDACATLQHQVNPTRAYYLSLD